MSKRKERITEKLKGINADWVSRTDKYISPNDGFGARPTYHINSNNSTPNIHSIKRFHSLEAIEDYIAEIEDYIAETKTKTTNTYL